jgi:primosomal protein N'
MKLLRVALPVPVFHEFDYVAADDGSRNDRGRCVRVRMGSRRLLGVVVSNPSSTEVSPDSLVTID